MPGPLHTARTVTKRLVPAGWYERYKYWRLYGRLPALAHPRLFSERLLWLKLHDRNPLRRLVADKLTARDFVTARLGEAFLPRLLGVWDDAASIDFSRLPPRFVLKPTHGSGMVQLVWDRSGHEPASLRRQCQHWLAVDYAAQEREWIYRGLPRRILAEELLESPVAGDAVEEYRFYVFRGLGWLVQVDPFGGHRRSVFDRHFQLLPYGIWGHPRFGPLPRPAAYDELLRTAERLGREFDFVRVDLYAVGTRVVVGELTCFPGAGHRVYEPGLDRFLAEGWARGEQAQPGP